MSRFGHVLDGRQPQEDLILAIIGEIARAPTKSIEEISLSGEEEGFGNVGDV